MDGLKTVRNTCDIFLIHVNGSSILDVRAVVRKVNEFARPTAAVYPRKEDTGLFIICAEIR